MVMLGAGGGVGHLVTQLAAKVFGQRVIGIDQAGKGDVVKQSEAEVLLDIMKVGQDLPAEVKWYPEGLALLCAQLATSHTPNGSISYDLAVQSLVLGCQAVTLHRLRRQCRA